MIKKRAELANLNDCLVPFLSRAADNLCWYYILYIWHVKYLLFQLPASCCADYEKGDVSCDLQNGFDKGCAPAMYLWVDQKIIVIAAAIGEYYKYQHYQN